MLYCNSSIDSRGDGDGSVCNSLCSARREFFEASDEAKKETWVYGREEETKGPKMQKGQL